MNNLVRQLNTIKIAGGYSRDIVEATTNVKTWTQIPEANTPVIMVVDENSPHTYHAGTYVEITWNIALYGVMKNQSQLDMEEFITDIETCLAANAPLAFTDTGAVVSYIRVRDIITDNQLFAEIEGSQLFKVMIALTYTQPYATRLR